MAKALNNKHFVGVVGSDLYFKLYDKYRVKARPDGTSMSMTEEAVMRRLQFAEVTKLARRVRYVTSESFPHRPKQEKQWHTFTRLNYPQFTVTDAASGTVSVDYGKLQFSQGDMMPPMEVTVTYSEENHTLSFQMVGGSKGVPGCEDSDLIRCVVLVTDADYTLALPVELGTRGEGGMVTESLDSSWSREKLHVYVYAQKADGTDVSVTKHLEVG